jgi:transcriptional regulator with XRE-family HTH domain
MARTPKRAGRKPQAGALFPSQVVVRNLQAYRALRGYTQEDLGARLRSMDSDLTASALGFVERGDRTLAVDELVQLAVALEVPVSALLDSGGPLKSTGPYLDLGGGRVLDPPYARWLTTSPDLDDQQSHAVAAAAGLTSPNTTTTRRHVAPETTTTEGK